MTTTTIATFVGNGSQTDFAFSFDYLRKEFVKVLVDGIETAYTFHTTQTVRVTPAPAVGKVVIVRRITDRDRLVQFVDGSILIANDLNVAALQSIHIASEALDQASGGLLIDETGAYSAGFRKLALLGDPTNARDAVNKQWAETGLTSQLALATAEKSAAMSAKDAALISQTAAAGSAAAALADRNLAQTAKTGADTAKTGADTAKTGADTAKTNADAAKVAAEAARDLALGYRNTTQTLRDEVIIGGSAVRTRLLTAGDGINGGGDLTADRTFDVDATVVRTTGNQTLAGTKDFSGILSNTGNNITLTRPGYSSWGITTDAAASLSFMYPNGTGRVAFASNGNLWCEQLGGWLVQAITGVGQNGLYGGAGILFNTGGRIRMTTGHLVNFHWNNGFYYNIDNNGYVLINASSSDERLKNMAADPSVAEAEAAVNALQPRRYSFKEGLPISNPEGELWGFTAQNIQTVFPSAVEERGMPDTEDTYLALNITADTQMIAALTKVVQQLMVEVAELKARL